MPALADKEKLAEVANFLINERGYLVVGVYRTIYQIGHISHLLWNVEVEQPLRVIAETYRSDWEKQTQLVINRFRSFYLRTPEPRPYASDSANYYRMITD